MNGWHKNTSPAFPVAWATGRHSVDAHAVRVVEDRLTIDQLDPVAVLMKVAVVG